jgi:hypothetical protein
MNREGPTGDTAPAPTDFTTARRGLWQELHARMPEARPGPGLAPLLDAAAALEAVLAVYTSRGHAHGTVTGATTDQQVDDLLQLLGPLPVGADAGRATVAVEVSAPLVDLRLIVRSKDPSAIYESRGRVVLDPRRNRWSLRPEPRRVPSEHDPLRLATASFGLRIGGLVVFRDAARRPTAAARVAETSEVVGPDGATYVDVTLTAPGPVGALPVLQTPATQVAVASTAGNTLQLDGYHPMLRPGRVVVVTSTTGAHVVSIETHDVASVVVVPDDDPSDDQDRAVRVPVSMLTISEEVSDAHELHFDFVDAATIAQVRPHVLTSADLVAGLPVAGPVDPPATAGAGDVLEQRFLLQDDDGRGIEVTGSLTVDAAERTAVFRADAVTPGVTLRMPVTLFGNLVDVTEGETVAREVLGSGDPTDPAPRFPLGRTPLIHLPPESGHPDRRSSLEVFVDGQRWEQVPSFHGQPVDGRVYVVEQSVDGAATVVFGRPLSAGTDNVTAAYRHGGTGRAAAAGSIDQAVGAPAAVRAVHQPTAGTAGTTAVTPTSGFEALRTETLMLDRAVSSADVAARAVRQPGVVRAAADLRWVADQQRVGFEVRYVGSIAADDLVTALEAVTEPGMTVVAAPAVPIPSRLELTVALDGSRPGDDVIDDVLAALLGDDGLLAPTRVPIGHRLPMEHLHARLVPLEGVARVEAVALVQGGTRTHDGDLTAGLPAAAGHYLDFTAPGAIDVTTTGL